MKILEEAVDSIHAASKTIVTLGIVLAILGVLSVLAPMASGVAVQAIVGLVMIGAGITWTVFSIHANKWGSGVWEALLGVLAVVSGVVMLAHPLLSLAALTLVLAGYFISVGALKIVFAFQERPMPGWGFVLLNGIISMALGALLAYQWPFSGIWAVGTLVGVDFMFGGFSLIRIGSVSENTLHLLAHAH
jgi:uncharacterized membrane protein HdeD (DUF308 family)